MRGAYNLTAAGLRNAAQHGITAVEVFEVIDSRVRLFSRVGDQSMLVLSITAAGASWSWPPSRTWNRTCGTWSPPGR